jgi:hypothetical protein
LSDSNERQSRATWYLIPLTSVMSITLNHWAYLKDVGIAMCGRYSLGLSNEEVYDGLEARLPQLFEQGRPRWEREQDHRPRYGTSTSAHAELRIGIM